MIPLRENSLDDISDERKLSLTAFFFFFFSGYLNENGHLNLKNFERYLEKLSEVRCCFPSMPDNSQKSLP